MLSPELIIDKKKDSPRRSHKTKALAAGKLLSQTAFRRVPGTLPDDEIVIGADFQA